MPGASKLAFEFQTPCQKLLAIPVSFTCWQIFLAVTGNCDSCLNIEWFSNIGDGTTDTVDDIINEETF